MQKKQGISLIVLVITIIVMIILAASVVITLSNTGVIDRASNAVDLTNERQVQDMAALIWADAYMDNLRGTALVTKVIEELGKQGVTETDWNITVTDSGISINKPNNIEIRAAGLYKSNGEYVSWETLISNDVIRVSGTGLVSGFDGDGNNRMSSYLDGELVLPNDGSITEILGQAFCCCENLTGLVVPEGVTEIPMNMLFETQKLTTLTLPTTITRIEAYIFYSPNLTTINYNGTKAQWNAIEKDELWDDSTGEYTIYCSDGNVEK